MNNLMSLVFLVVGIILLVMGITSADSIASQFTRFFSGHPTDKAIWMILGGAALTIIGLGSTWFGHRRV